MFATLPFDEVFPVQVAQNLQDYTVIDVRTPGEFHGFLGHIPGAELVTFPQLPAKAQSWKKDQKLLFVCRSGNRSGMAKALMQAQGFANVRNLTGGVLAWKEAFGESKS